MPMWVVWVTIGISLLSPLGTMLMNQRGYGRLLQRVDNHDEALDRLDTRITGTHERCDKIDSRIGASEAVQREQGSEIGRLQGLAERRG